MTLWQTQQNTFALSLVSAVFFRASDLETGSRAPASRTELLQIVLFEPQCPVFVGKPARVVGPHNRPRRRQQNHVAEPAGDMAHGGPGGFRRRVHRPAGAQPVEDPLTRVRLTLGVRLVPVGDPRGPIPLEVGDQVRVDTGRVRPLSRAPRAIRQPPIGPSATAPRTCDVRFLPPQRPGLRAKSGQLRPDPARPAWRRS